MRANASLAAWRGRSRARWATARFPNPPLASSRPDAFSCLWRAPKFACDTRLMTNAREFTARLADLLRREHAAMADFLVQLAEFDAQKLWRDLGHASLFSFLRRELGLSAGAAQYRKTAAELVQRFPEVEAALRAGRLCLSSVVEVAKVLTHENAAEVLPRFYGLSSRDAAMVAVSIRPVENAPRREVVTVRRTTAAARSDLAAARESPEPDPETPMLAFRAPETPANEATRAPAKATEPLPAPPVARRDVEPLDAEHVRLHLTVSRGFMAKLLMKLAPGCRRVCVQTIGRVASPAGYGSGLSIRVVTTPPTCSLAGADVLPVSTHPRPSASAASHFTDLIMVCAPSPSFTASRKCPRARSTLRSAGMRSRESA